MKQIKDFDLAVFLAAIGLTDAELFMAEIREESDAGESAIRELSDACKLQVYLNDSPLEGDLEMGFGIAGHGIGFHIGVMDGQYLLAGKDVGEIGGEEIRCAFSSIALLIWAEAKRDVPVAKLMKQGLAPFFEA